MQAVIYHNPKCSKSRQTLELLQNQDIELEIVEYLKKPLNKAQINEILGLLNLSPRELMRTNEAEYRENQLDNPELSQDQLLAAMVAHPILIQRPIVIANGKARIDRPPEKVMESI